MFIVTIIVCFSYSVPHSISAKLYHYQYTKFNLTRWFNMNNKSRYNLSLFTFKLKSVFDTDLQMTTRTYCSFSLRESLFQKISMSSEQEAKNSCALTLLHLQYVFHLPQNVIGRALCAARSPIPCKPKAIFIFTSRCDYWTIIPSDFDLCKKLNISAQ